jgi:hypothetical protein
MSDEYVVSKNLHGFYFSRSTAAIKFRNGTILNVAQIPGLEEYISAMGAFAEGALRVSAEPESYL